MPLNFKFSRSLFIIALFLCISSELVRAQIYQPVKWQFTSNKLNDSEIELVLTAQIEKGWHLYSQFIQDGGPVPTSFKFEKSSDYDLLGKVSETSKVEELLDPNFDMVLKFFSHQAVFKQKIKVKTPAAFTLKGSVEFMVCDDSKCLPPEEIEFGFSIQGTKGGKTPEIKKDSLITLVHLPATMDTVNQTGSGANTLDKTSISPASATELEPGCGSTSEGVVTISLWGIFIAGAIGGFLALLTPCVFPMIPLTVSFFTKQSKTRSKGIINACIYAVSIIAIYVILGLLITVFFGSDALNDMASNVVFNMAFFIIFVIFAISFFGAFEITLPSSFINKADAASERGGLLGIFFMAFTLSLVSFSCTGPIIGTLLVEAAQGRSYLGPFMGMAGFSVALAIPFALFAAFPGWLNSLPKSGGWLNSVKVTLGFIELALALKFLSNVDLAYHWGILKREVFIALWIIIFGLLGIYLLGKIKFSHDSDTKYVSIPRLIMAIITFSFTVYMIPGIWGAPLNMITGYLPPSFYKEWTGESSSSCPHNLNCFHDYEEGMRYAKEHGKPVMIDFTGWACVNCRKMEDNVWSKPDVLKRLSDQYVLISLYVDDKKPLAEEKQYISENGKKIKTYGNKWSDFQAKVYKTNSQPYYVLLDHNGNILAEPRGYTPDVETYVSFLDEGLCRFSKRKNKN